jgi:hypothetical protein
MKLRIIVTKNQIGFLTSLGIFSSFSFIRNNKLKIYDSSVLSTNYKNYKKIIFTKDENKKVNEFDIHIKELRNKSINIVDYKFTIKKILINKED